MRLLVCQGLLCSRNSRWLLCSVLYGLFQRLDYNNILQRAVCEAYGIVINVITSDQQHWFMRYEPEAQPKKSMEVFVTYIAPIHYNAVR